MTIQTFGLLTDIRKRVYATGDASVTWAEMESFAAPLKISNLPAMISAWAEDNMMWVEFKYENGQADRKIASVIFGASR